MDGDEKKRLNKEFWDKVKSLGGWRDKDMIRFPNVHNKEQFEKWCAERSEAMNQPKE